MIKTAAMSRLVVSTFFPCICLIPTVCAGGDKIKDIDCYLVSSPISSRKILPDTLRPSHKIGTELKLIAAPGEYEPASFVLRPAKQIDSLSLKATDLKGKSGVIPSSNIDIKIVKCWYQSGTAWEHWGQNKSKRILVPELLLNDAALVKVDYAKRENYLKLRYPEEDKYVWISDAKDTRANRWGMKLSNEKFPVKDSSSLLPVNLEKGSNQQFWVTIKVPQQANPGFYTGEISLSTPQGKLGSLTIKLRVLPFRLAKPKTNYDLKEDFISSIYHVSAIDTNSKGGIPPHHKTEQQFKKELENLYKHGVTHPLVYQLQFSNDMKLFAKVLEMRKAAGLEVKPLYLLGPEQNLGFKSPSDPVKLNLLKQKVKKILAVVKKVYGHTDVYFYGHDEAIAEAVTAQRPAWEAIHQAGGKVFCAGYTARIHPPGNFALAGDIQDLLISAGKPDKQEAKKWHGKGHKIFCYGNPQTGVENPEVYRRNFGLLLWHANYDGAATYCYYESFGNTWNDFDHIIYRDENIVYPTTDGVIDTIAWEGYREGVDDIRYATTLKLEIKKAKNSKDGQKRQIALAAEKYLENLDVENENLDIIRMEMIKYILRLKGIK